MGFRVFSDVRICACGSTTLAGLLGVPAGLRRIGECANLNARGHSGKNDRDEWSENTHHVDKGPPRSAGASHGSALPARGIAERPTTNNPPVTATLARRVLGALARDERDPRRWTEHAAL